MRERLKDEHGAIAVLAALTIVILFAAVAFVIDISRLYHERQVLQNAVDFGSLAGAQDLPVQGSAQANDRERGRANRRDRERAAGGHVRPHHRLPVRRRRPQQRRHPRSRGHPVRVRPDGHVVVGMDGQGRSRMVHDCNPFAGDKCNTIRLTTSNTIPYYFAPVIGINTGNTGTVAAASCKGACGAAMSPVDVVMVLDRTGSMTASDVANVKNAALSVLDFYEPADQWIGLVTLPYGKGSPGSLGTSGKCIGVRRSPNDATHVSGVSHDLGFHAVVGDVGTEPELQDRRRGAQPQLQSRPGDQLPPASGRLGLFDVPGRLSEREPHEPRGSIGRGSCDARHLWPTDRARRHHLHDGRPGEPAEHDAAVRLLQQQGHDREERRADDLHDRLRPRQPARQLREQRLRRVPEPARDDQPRVRRDAVDRRMARHAATRSRTRTATTTSAPRRPPTSSRCSARWRPPRSRPRT